MKILGIYIMALMISLGVSQEVKRSSIADFLLPPGAWSMAGTKQADTAERMIDNLAAKIGRECRVFEGVFWDKQDMPRGSKAIKEEVVARIKRRGWTYQIFSQSQGVQMFLTGGGYISILGGWVETRAGELILTWCLLR